MIIPDDTIDKIWPDDGYCGWCYRCWTRKNNPPGPQRTSDLDYLATKENVDKFWEKVKKTNNCWLWVASLTEDGYGRLLRQRNGERRLFLAHRYAWLLSNGEIPDGLCVLHTCDTPACVRPNHLFLGTQLDNIDDMTAKGRARTTLRKLTVSQVDELRRLRKAGWMFKDLSKKYGVSHTTVLMAALGRHYLDATEPAALKVSYP